MSEFQNDRWALPNTWQWVGIGEIADVIGGGTPSTINAGNFGGDIPWITPADMSAHVGKTIANGARLISAKGLEGSGARWLPKGSVLFSSRAPIGYVAIASQPVTTNQGFKSFVPAKGCDSDYLYYWLTSAKPLAEKLASGTTFLEISGAKAALIPFPVAPAAEQRRIVAKLEELLSDLDAGVAELKAAQKKLGQYRQSLLKAAVEGALTADWRAAQHAAHQPVRPEPVEGSSVVNASTSSARTDSAETRAAETGAALLARILTERRSRWEARQLAKFQAQGKPPPKDWQSKYPVPVAPETTGLPALPVGWVWASIDQLSPDDLANGRSVQTAEVGAKVLRLTSVKHGKIDLSECKIGAWSADESKPFAVVQGDLLIVRGNGSLTLVGRAGMVPLVTEQVAYPDTMIRLRVVDSVVRPEWVGLLWDASITRSHIEKRARTSAGIYKISQPDIVTVVIPVPPLNEQDHMLAMFKQVGHEMELVQGMVDHGLKQSAAQRKNILQAAFSGQLVPQDPADESASVLLARIRAERAARETGAARGRGKKTVAA